MATSNIKSDAYELDWLEYLFQATSFPAAFSHTANGPASAKMCLFKSDPRSIQGSALPVIDGVGSVEPSSTEYASYARLAVTRNSTEWTTATATGTSTAKKATNDLVFATAGGGSNVSITWVGLAIAKQDGSGDCLLYAWQLDTPLTVTSGIAPRISINDLVHEQR